MTHDYDYEEPADPILPDTSYSIIIAVDMNEEIHVIDAPGDLIEMFDGTENLTVGVACASENSAITNGVYKFIIRVAWEPTYDEEWPVGVDPVVVIQIMARLVLTEATD